MDSLTIGKNLLKKRILENEGNVDIEGTDIYHCVDVCCSKDFFYVLYNGARIKRLCFALKHKRDCPNLYLRPESFKASK